MYVEKNMCIYIYINPEPSPNEAPGLLRTEKRPPRKAPLLDSIPRLGFGVALSAIGLGTGRQLLHLSVLQALQPPESAAQIGWMGRLFPLGFNDLQASGCCQFFRPVFGERSSLESL